MAIPPHHIIPTSSFLKKCVICSCVCISCVCLSYLGSVCVPVRFYVGVCMSVNVPGCVFVC